MKVIFNQNTQQHTEEGGNALLITLVFTFIFMILVLTLLTSVQVNRNTVESNFNSLHAKQTALTGMRVAVDQINDFLLNGETNVSQTEVGNIVGIARSRDEPGQDTGAAITARPQGTSIEDTLVQTSFVNPSAPMPNNATMLQQVNGFYTTRSSPFSDGSWKVRSRGKWRDSISKIVTLMIPVQGTPFSLGVYGAEGVFVDGPGLIDWINSDDPTDLNTPIVLESGFNIFITKEPEDSGS